MAVPTCLRIRYQFEQRIRSGTLTPGSRLPTEAELQRRTTISFGWAFRWPDLASTSTRSRSTP